MVTFVFFFLLFNLSQGGKKRWLLRAFGPFSRVPHCAPLQAKPTHPCTVLLKVSFPLSTHSLAFHPQPVGNSERWSRALGEEKAVGELGDNRAAQQIARDASVCSWALPSHLGEELCLWFQSFWEFLEILWKTVWVMDMWVLGFFPWEADP